MATCAPAWLSRLLTDVPAGDAWLGERERTAQPPLRFAPRRDMWRLGRWTAKLAVAAWLELSPSDVQVLAAADGAPEAWRGDTRLPVSLSLSHRAGRALAVVGDDPAIVGCDLELIEERSAAFCRTWLTTEEQNCVTGSDGASRPLIANLIWSAKEAAAKVRRQGLRLDPRSAEVAATFGATTRDAWRPLAVAWRDGADETPGWWRADDRWVMTIASGSVTLPPVILSSSRVHARRRRSLQAGPGGS